MVKQAKVTKTCLTFGTVRSNQPITKLGLPCRCCYVVSALTADTAFTHRLMQSPDGTSSTAVGGSRLY